MVTDGPFLESKEWLAGYRLVDVVSLDRAHLLERAGAPAAAATGYARAAGRTANRAERDHLTLCAARANEKVRRSAT